VRKIRFTEEQILGIVAEAEHVPVGEVCRKHDISVKTYHHWKAKCRGMSVPEARRLKQLEEEHTRLKRLVAGQALELSLPKDLLRQYT
jgi:transposase-like protein